MPKDNLFTFSPSDYAVYTSILGTAMPTSLPTSGTSNPGTGWYDCGFLSDAGTSEGHNYNENKVYDMVGALLRVVRNQEERPWTFECVQYDAVVAGLKYPGTTVSTTGATAEVQTVTITGSPTGGTFTLSLAGFGTVTVPYNVATAALATAILNAWDLTVTVTGTAGTSYVVTFPASEGNIAQMTAAGNFTGGTTPTIAVATTTPGVTGINTRNVGSGVARNLRQFCVDLIDGTTAKRVLMANAEAVWTGTVTDNSSGIEIVQFQLQPYKDANGFFYSVLDNAAGMGLTFA